MLCFAVLCLAMLRNTLLCYESDALLHYPVLCELCYASYARGAALRYATLAYYASYATLRYATLCCASYANDAKLRYSTLTLLCYLCCATLGYATLAVLHATT